MIRGGVSRVAVVLALVLVLAACRGEGQRHDCTCTFLTDFDDPSTQEVAVCASSSDDAPSIARGCAREEAPGPVQTCSCGPARPAPGCASGTCIVSAR